MCLLDVCPKALFFGYENPRFYLGFKESSSVEYTNHSISIKIIASLTNCKNIKKWSD